MTTSGHVRNGGPRSLDEAIAYRNRHVIDRFVERYALPRAEAEDLFVETLRWLWLCARAERDPDAPEVFIDDCMALLDEMWHTFLLFTREYSDYCAANLGGYVHHAPTQRPRTSSASPARSPAIQKDSPRRRRSGCARTYEYVYDQLGEDAGQVVLDLSQSTRRLPQVAPHRLHPDLHPTPIPTIDNTRQRRQYITKKALIEKSIKQNLQAERSVLA